MSNNMLLCCVLFILSVLNANCLPATDGRVDEVTVTVNTANGQVRGHRAYTIFDQKLFYSFKGIPYAQPPLGNLRFKPPLPASSWNGVLDAEHFGNVCIQPMMGSEDCLFLNVYTPNVAPAQRLPVFFVIHGGAFAVGSSNEHEPDFLFNQGDFVMVNMNYRLGAFGFLTFRTPEYSGNMGLKDQQLALQWVRDNIHNFGGDPNQITIYGISAGAVSAHSHVLSESSQGLFQRAIIVSGSCLNPIAVTTENFLRRSILFAEENGLFTNDANEIIAFLESADASLFFAPGSVMLPGSLDYGLTVSEFTWLPTVEPAGSASPFLLRSPNEILRNGFATNIDTLFAVATEESMFFIDPEMNNPDLLSPIDASFGMEFPIYSINERFDFNSAQFSQISAQIRQYYFGNEAIDIRTIPNYAELRSDIMFNFGVDRTARYHAGSPNANTYFYRFSVDGALNILKLGTIAHAYGLEGATHGDDSFYVFRSPQPEVNTIYSLLAVNSLERQTIDRLCEAYVSFIRTGTLPGYPQVQPNSLNFIDYTNDGPIASTNPFEARINFWNNLLQEHGLF